MTEAQSMELGAHVEEAYSLLTKEEAFKPQTQGWLSGVRTHWKDVAIALLLASNLLWLVASLAPSRSRGWDEETGRTDSRVAIVPTLRQIPKQFHWYTDYGSPNDTDADALWDAISTAHGVIAESHEFAVENQWMGSMSLPGDASKGVYLLESYHQMHCLKIVRKVFLESVYGRPLSYPVQHARHCFDYFRQFIMCHADNTPLYSIGDHTSGDGQWHMCNDWTALRDYATEKSACFRDRVGNESLEEQFEHCDGGSDGLEAA